MIKYRTITGYKYQLTAPYSIDVEVYPFDRIDTPFLSLSTEGNLLIKSGYCWDGASGPTVDTDSNMRASLVHDAIYQLIRECLIPLKFKDYADRLFYQLLLEDGMHWIRAKYYYYGVKYFGAYALKPQEVT